jgi:hypothetical protein
MSIKILNNRPCTLENHYSLRKTLPDSPNLYDPTSKPKHSRNLLKLTEIQLRTILKLQIDSLEMSKISLKPPKTYKKRVSKHQTS